MTKSQSAQKSMGNIQVSQNMMTKNLENTNTKMMMMKMRTLKTLGTKTKKRRQKQSLV